MLPHCKRQAKSWGAHFMASMGPAGVFCLPPLCTRRCLPGAAPLLEEEAGRFFEGGLPSPVPSSSLSSRRSPAKGLGRSRGNLCFAACPSWHVASCCTDSAHPAQHRLQRKTTTLAQIAIATGRTSCELAGFFLALGNTRSSAACCLACRSDALTRERAQRAQSHTILPLARALTCLGRSLSGPAAGNVQQLCFSTCLRVTAAA